LLLVMLIGAALVRAAGCIINDLADRNLDAHVERTKNRPLASGKVSTHEAMILLAVLLSVALVIALSLPISVLPVAFLAVPMIAAYPWMKRITWWPQLFLGLTFNLGAVMGWLATGAAFSLPTVTLYLACVLWTLGYDTIYAIQDREGDARIGIKSTALLLGDRIAVFVTGCFIAMQGLLLITGFLAKAGPLFLVGIAVMAWLMRQQIKRLAENPVPADALFVSNQWLGLTLTVALILDRLFIS
jgi:4-hydroxybenzoate polyprenyltransferase